MYIFLGVYVFIVVGILLMLFRNQKVCNYRKKLMDEFFYNSNLELEKSDNLEKWRKDFDSKLKILESVTYDEMVWKFWKPLDSFYKNIKK
jgi:hypothetical protein